MASPVRPVATPDSTQPDVEGALAKSANDAIAAGKDPAAVSQRLGTVVNHLRANPDVMAQARAAMARGVDPALIGARTYEHALANPTPAHAPAPAPSQYTPGQQFGTVVAQGATFGFAPKILGGLDAADKYLHGDHNFAANYAATRDRIAGAEDEAFREHPIASTVAELASGVGTALPASAGHAVAEAPSLAKAVGRGVVQGAGYGALSGAGHATGGVDDYARAMLHDAAIGAVAGGVAPAAGRAIGKTASVAIDAIGRPTDTRPVLTVPVLNTPVGRIEGVRDRAATIIAKRAALDASAGHVPPVTSPAIRTLPLDQAGPNVEGLAEGIANRPGPGRAVIQKALDERAAQMRPAITSAFDDATGTTAADGEALLRQLHDEQSGIASAGRVADAVAKDAKGAKPDVQVTTPNAADVWRQEIGGQHPNGIAALRQIADQQRTQADQLYGAARAATAGQAIDSPTLRQYAETPVGKLALGWAREQMANRLRSLPTQTETVLPPAMQQMLDEAKPADRPAMLAKMQATGAGTDIERELPNPELLHYAKQYTAKLARMGVNDGAQGTVATQAQGALPLFDAIKAELPPEWRTADQAFAKHARLMDALNAGRNILRTQVNPAGAGKKALFTSLDALEQKVPTLSPEEQQAFRLGAQSAHSDFLTSGKNTKAFAAQLADPQSPVARRVVLATGDPNAPARLAAKLQPTTATKPQLLLKAPDVPTLSPTGQGAAQGLDVLSHHVSAPGNAPERSLAIYADRAKALPPDGRVALQQGAAQALRGQWEGTGRSVKSPGRVFDFSSPEKAAQMSYAFQSPAKQQAFREAVDAWDRAQAQRDRILGNSRTGLRGAEGSGMSIRAATLMQGARAVTRSLIDKITGGVALRNQQRVEAEVARLLTDPDLRALPSGQRVAMLHDHIAKLVTENAPSAALTGPNKQ